MRFATLVRWGVVALAAALLVSGCGNDADPLSTSSAVVGGDNAIDQIDLDEAYGGLAFTDEPTAFGDEELLRESLTIDQDLSIEDDENSILHHDPRARNHREMKRTIVRILWGRLDGLSDSTEWNPQDIVDWTGQLEVSEGVVALKRTILFETPIDHILPREDRSILAWQSFTGPHFDGILVNVIQFADSNGVYPDGEFRFRTGPYSTSFSLAQLDSVQLLETVDELGNAVSIEAMPVDLPCPRGFVRGHWARTPGEEGGIFEGIWISRFAAATGFVRGRWGVNAAGERVLAGKIIGRDGEIRGLMEGRWELLDDGRGVFRAHWAGSSGAVEGFLRGEFRCRHDGDLGFFRARWRARCGGMPVDGPDGGD